MTRRVITVTTATVFGKGPKNAASYATGQQQSSRGKTKTNTNS